MVEQIVAEALRTRQVLAALRRVEEHVELVGGDVADRAHDVGVHHVVDQRDVLVADALDVVLAVAVLEHRRTLERLDGDDLGAVLVLQPVAGSDRAGRAGRRDERRQSEVASRRRTDRLEHVAERPTRHGVVAEVVPELAELVEDEVAGILGELVAGVVDLLDVRLGAVGADHVFVGVLAPPVQPVETLLAHALGQDRNAAAGHDAADRDAAAGVVAGRRPDRPVVGRVELAGDDSWGEACVRGEHLVGGDHREPVAEHDDDRARHTRQFGWQHDVLRNVDATAGEVVVPVNAPQVAGVLPLRIGVADVRGVVERGRVGELGEGRQRDAALAEAGDRVGERRLVDDPVGQAELVLECGAVFVDGCHLVSLSNERARRIAAGQRPGFLDAREPARTESGSDTRPAPCASRFR